MATKKEIFEANIRTHRAEAYVYDTRHGGIFNRYAQATIKRLIKNGLDILLKNYDPEMLLFPYALDCACGTGNIAEKLLYMGCKVDAVDISTQMLEVLNSKLKEEYKGQYRIINNDVDSYLESVASESYHIISFSSALHHVPDYAETFLKAIKILKRPGVIFVFHEPLATEMIYISAISQILRKIDRFVWKYSGKILRKKAPTETISAEDADLTDFHARRGGVDPKILMEISRKNKGEIVAFERKSENMRHWWSAWLDNFFNLRRDGYYLSILFR
jgi:ubiquinone/menaquinone biosynthesis C-methylase UbiE